MVYFSGVLKYLMWRSCEFQLTVIILAHMLKRIILHNFMSHSHTVIDLSPGLTVLTGPNNCGKSAFVSALQFLAENPKANFMIRHGAKECRVIVETDDDHTIEWKRKKLNASYTIDGEDVHRKTPTLLHEILRLSKVEAGNNDQFDVHFGEQKSPIFLLNDPPSRAAAFFASSSDASVLIEMQKRHRGKVKSAQQELTRLQAESKQTDAIVEVLAPVPGLEVELEEHDKTYQELILESQQIQQLESLIQELQDSSQVVSQLEDSVKALSSLPEALQQENEKPLELLVQRLADVKQQVRRTQFDVEALSGLNEPPAISEIDSMAILIDELQIQERNLEWAALEKQCLKQLNEPPELPDTGPLQMWIEKIQQAEGRVDTDRAEYKILENCTSPPELVDLLSMESFYQQWEETQSLVGQLQQVCHECHAEYKAVRAELEDWVKENPTCPTCGSKWETEQFLQSAETGLKGHTHGG